MLYVPPDPKPALGSEPVNVPDDVEVPVPLLEMAIMDPVALLPPPLVAANTPFRRVDAPPPVAT